MIKACLRHSLAALTLAAILTCPAVAAESRSVAGEWRIAFDPGRVGERERWFERDLPGPETVSLPGPIDRRDGPVWLQYTLMIPGSWKGKRVWLSLERASGATDVWIDGTKLPGTEGSRVAPHVHPLGEMGKPATRRLTVRLENRADGDHPEGSPTHPPGLFGGLEIQGVDPVAIDDIQIEPDPVRGLIRIRSRLSNTTGVNADARLRLEVRERPGTAPLGGFTLHIPVHETSESGCELELGPRARLWDDATPNLYSLRASLSATVGGKALTDERVIRFGLRTFARDAEGFLLNGRRVELRGAHDGTLLPGMGAASTSLAEWRRAFRTLRGGGRNLAEFRGWCPPEAAFAAADAEGILLQVGAPGDDHERELTRILRAYGNHPSFGILTVTPDPGESGEQTARRLERLRRDDPRHVLIIGRGLAGPPAAK